MSSASPHRTTSTVAPLATSPAASAAENVAMPHGVGGNVDRMPNERRAGHGNTVHEGTPTTTSS